MANIQGDSVQSAAGEQKIKQLEQKQQQHCNPQRDVFFLWVPIASAFFYRAEMYQWDLCLNNLKKR